MENLGAQIDALFARTDELYFATFQLVLDGIKSCMHNSLYMADEPDLTPEEQAEKDFGHPEGHEYDNEHGTEVVVYDRDEDGNIIGWHKELKSDG